MNIERRYLIKNWSEYNKALISRGNITLWINEDTIQKWYSQDHTGEKGRPNIYSDDAILCALIFREVFKLPLRTLQGFLQSILLLMAVPVKTPSYTQISRRAQKLNKLLQGISKKNPRDIVFDSTGLKVYGEGEWKVKIHGKSKRRTWRKFHIGIDPHTQEIVLAELTHNNKSDAQAATKMLKRHKGRIDSAYGDGAYDDQAFRKSVHNKGGRCKVPPPRNAAYKRSSSGWEAERDADIAAITGLGGDDEARRIWKILTGYYRRSLAETAMFRMKQMFGCKLKARSWGGQQAEAACKCLALNKMTKLGMPKGEWIKVAV